MKNRTHKLLVLLLGLLSEAALAGDRHVYAAYWIARPRGRVESSSLAGPRFNGKEGLLDNAGLLWLGLNTSRYYADFFFMRVNEPFGTTKQTLSADQLDLVASFGQIEKLEYGAGVKLLDLGVTEKFETIDVSTRGNYRLAIPIVHLATDRVFKQKYHYAAQVRGMWFKKQNSYLDVMAKVGYGTAKSSQINLGLRTMDYSHSGKGYLFGLNFTGLFLEGAYKF